MRKPTERRWVRLAIAVQRRGSTDGTRFLAAALTFYGFVSLFPLMLLALSVIGFVLSGDDAARAEWVDRLSGEIPGLGSLIGRNLDALVHARAVTGLVGLAGLVYTGVDVIQAGEHGLGRIFRTGEGGGVIWRRVRSYLLLFGVGPVALASMVATGLAAQLSGSGFGGFLLSALGTLVALAVDFCLFAVVYRWVTPRPGPSLREHLPGAVATAVGWTILKFVGSWYATALAADATAVYGTFAAVVGVLAILHLLSRLFLQGAELSAVLIEQRAAERPRS